VGFAVALLIDATMSSNDRDVLPMGWMDWSMYRCGISEELIRNATLAMVEHGWLDAGYDTVHIDDCWAAKERDASGRLIADPSRFPSGIKALTDWVHSRGMKLGIYSAAAPQTCAKFQPGSEGSEDIDAQTFIDWGVDYLKYDGCQSDMTRLSTSYKAMGDALRGSKIQYSCSFGAHGGQPPEMIEDGCDTWRIWHDIEAKKGYNDLIRISSHWAGSADTWRQWSGPSSKSRGWFDPDQLLAGDERFSVDETIAQLGLWTMLSAPLIMGNRVADHLVKPNPAVKAAFQNPEIIAIARDPLAVMGGRVGELSDDREVWARKLDGGALAVLFWNKATPDACTWHITQDQNSKDKDDRIACFKGSHFEYTRLECCANSDCQEFSFTAPGGAPADVGNGCLFQDAPADIWHETPEVARFTLKTRDTSRLVADLSVDLSVLADVDLWNSTQAAVRNVLQRKDLGVMKDSISVSNVPVHGVVMVKLTPVVSVFV